MNTILEQIGRIGIVPVVKIDRAEDAVPLARALCAGGLPCAEVTFRTDAAAEAIRQRNQTASVIHFLYYAITTWLLFLNFPLSFCSEISSIFT